MYVIRLPNGNLLVPDSAISAEGRLMSDAYVEVSPADAEYERFAAEALTQEEYDRRRQGWHEGDEPLRRQFLEFLARGGYADSGCGDPPDGDGGGRG